ncbi:MAG: hypothetical protein J0H09_18585 [Burkholderiales bacterium]|nr:hypothetical protein [Burkholderiales bacterium]
MKVESAGRTIWQKHMSVLPERRILVPLATVLQACDKAETISIGFIEDKAS